MNTINTTLPVALEDMKRIITSSDATIHIRMADATIKGRTALIYMSNANLAQAKIDVTDVPAETVFELIDAYITLKSTLPNRNLIGSVMQIVYACKGIQLLPIDQTAVDTLSLITRDQVQEYMSDQARADNVLKLIHVLDNITTFVACCHESLRSRVGEDPDVPVINDIDYTGYTYINLLEVEQFMLTYYSAPRSTTYAYFSQQYDGYMYGGKNLFAIMSGTFMVPLMSELSAGSITPEMIAQARNESEQLDVNT